ncbi:hypothetical protein L1987_45427 [Smallanthus sonchifolius]|uniref:Uncharacterized protein n=1 Tax=Smallanthus sonchifolius TaxID=185202 RepID=A0ACB9FXK0_9ASTR|nr:hypothetical protein L1987_45427 [Smallanthus sonchifolius]
MCKSFVHRYENYGVIFGNQDLILDENDAYPGGVCSNESASHQITIFNQVVENLLSDIPRTSNFYVASTKQVSTDNATVYAIAQCAKKISKAICHGSFKTAYNNLQGCLPRKEGRAVDFFCFMRYSDTPFFHSNQTTNIIHFLSEGSSSNSTTIAGVSSAVGLVFLILALWLWYRKMKKAKTVEETESGLQLEKTYQQLATHDFGEEYRVGKGSFGEVFKEIRFENNSSFLQQAFIDDENVVAVKRLHVDI